MKKYYKLFNDYVKKFNFKDSKISGKFHHTYRVMEFCKDIAESLKLTEEDTKIAMLCGLFHDIGRFNQATKYHTFIDNNSIDHADEGYRVLLENNFIENKYKKIVLESVKNHNKFKINANLDEKTQLFCNIVRDADKLDIIMEQNNKIEQNSIVLKKELLDSIYNGRIINNDDVKNTVDSILRTLSWINDLNFKYSYKFLLDNEIFLKKIMLLEKNGKTEEINMLKEKVLSKLKEMC